MDPSLEGQPPQVVPPLTVIMETMQIGSEEVPLTQKPTSPESKRSSDTTTCIAKSAVRPNLVLPAERINARAQKMRDHALIGKFIGIWPTEQALRGWIQNKWKPKAHYDLQLGSKGFFTIFFHHLDDKEKVEDGGPYFFNSTEIYLRN